MTLPFNPAWCCNLDMDLGLNPTPLPHSVFLGKPATSWQLYLYLLNCNPGVHVHLFQLCAEIFPPTSSLPIFDSQCRRNQLRDSQVSLSHREKGTQSNLKTSFVSIFALTYIFLNFQNLCLSGLVNQKEYLGQKLQSNDWEALQILSQVYLSYSCKCHWVFL